MSDRSVVVVAALKRTAPLLRFIQQAVGNLPSWYKLAPLIRSMSGVHISTTSLSGYDRHKSGSEEKESDADVEAGK